MNFENLGKKFKKFSQDTVTEVQKMNEVRQMNSRVSEQKKQIAVLYSQMGQKLYNLYKEAPLEGFEREFRELEEHYSEIEKYTEQVRRIKGVRVCPNCHTEVSVTERFCSSCGEKLPEVLHIEEDEEGKTVIEGTASEVIDEAAEPDGRAEESTAEASVGEPEAEAEASVEELIVEAETVIEEPAAEAEASAEESAVEAEESAEEAAAETEGITEETIEEAVNEILEADEEEVKTVSEETAAGTGAPAEEVAKEAEKASVEV